MRARSLVALASLGLGAGCFGGGPVPTAPSAATLVYAVPVPDSHDVCNGQAKYISDVALGATAGFVLALPYIPSTCNNSGGTPQSAAAPTQITLDGSLTSTSVGGAQAEVQQGSELPRVAALGDRLTWAYRDDTMGARITIRKPDLTIEVDTSTMGNQMAGGPAALAITPNGTTVLAVVAEDFVGTDPGDPNYPCCGATLAGSPPPTRAFLAVVAPGSTTATTLGATLGLFCDTLYHCVVATDSTAFVIEHAAQGSGIRIGQLDLATAPAEATAVDAIDAGLIAAVPVGLAADDTGVVYAASEDPTGFAGTRGCIIRRFDRASGLITPLLETTKFDCADVAIDHDAAYFAITEPTRANDNQAVRGIGLGRVAFADRALDTVRVDLFGTTAGARRVAIIGDQLFAIDPLSIARIAIADLRGRQDLAP